VDILCNYCCTYVCMIPGILENGEMHGIEQIFESQISRDSTCTASTNNLIASVAAL
jgi:hypothetical protein